MDLKRKIVTVDNISKLKRQGLASMNNNIKDSVKLINDCWVNNKSFDSDGQVQVNTVPFKHCIVQNLLKDTAFLKELKTELLDLVFLQKHNDLYQFHQSVDLSIADTSLINSLKEFLHTELQMWLSKATGINLNNKLSVTCSSYCYTDYLLCHDDKCEDRRIAFILYLNEDWLQDYGGSLDLFNTDRHGQPKEIVKSIWPTFNSLVFFEVMCKSFHQVSEIITADRSRLTVNGWFHGPLSKCEKTTTCINIDVPLFSPVKDNSHLSVLINPLYWDEEIQEQISLNFEQDSEVLLSNFFKKDFYDELCNSFNNEDLVWDLKGPANYRKYETLTSSDVPQPIVKLFQLFKSETFFRFLSILTKLELSSSENAKMKPQCSYEIQRWQKGFYTLLNDNYIDSRYALDVLLYCNVEKMNQFHGGFTSYVAREEDEELLTIFPCCNALALTFRDKDSLSFVKYISTLSRGHFNTIHFSYYEEYDSSENK